MNLKSCSTSGSAQYMSAHRNIITSPATGSRSHTITAPSGPPTKPATAGAAMATRPPIRASTPETTVMSRASPCVFHHGRDSFTS